MAYFSMSSQAIQLDSNQLESKIPLGSRIEKIGNLPTEYDSEILKWTNKIR